MSQGALLMDFEPFIKQQTSPKFQWTTGPPEIVYEDWLESLKSDMAAALIPAYLIHYSKTHSNAHILNTLGTAEWKTICTP